MSLLCLPLRAALPVLMTASAILCALVAWPAAGQDQEPAQWQSVDNPDGCPIYTVARGDTLRVIAEQALGDGDRAEELYQRNRDLIGRDRNLIEIGMPLVLPCDPGAAQDAMAESTSEDDIPVDVTQTSADAAAMAAADSKMLIPPRPVIQSADAARPLRFLTGGPLSPFVGQQLPQGGLITEVVAAALGTRGMENNDARAVVDFVNDRPAHLSVLLPSGHFDVSFPWVYPDCSRGELLMAERALCEEFIASEALYEHVTEFYTLAEGDWARARDVEAMQGGTLCRPDGYPLTDLVWMGLLPDRVTVMPAPDPETCLKRLDMGEVDFASLDASVTRALVNRLELENAILVIEPLTHVERLRAVARRDNPRGAEAIAAINDGLRQISESGDWFTIVQRHMRIIAGVENAG